MSRIARGVSPCSSLLKGIRKVVGPNSDPHSVFIHLALSDSFRDLLPHVFKQLLLICNDCIDLGMSAVCMHDSRSGSRSEHGRTYGVSGIAILVVKELVFEIIQCGATNGFQYVHENHLGLFSRCTLH